LDQDFSRIGFALAIQKEIGKKKLTDIGLCFWFYLGPLDNWFS
jgi:hypothetical protein